MFNQLKALATVYHNHNIKRARTQARSILLRQDDSTLFDIGVDRHELVGGVQNWPWDGSATSSGAQANLKIVKKSEVKKAVTELKNYSDRELQDIGINRGMIEDAVRNGRPELDDGNDTRRAA